MKFRSALLIPILIAVHACGGGGSADVDENLTIKGGRTAEPSGQSGFDFREFRMGAGVVQMLPIETRPLRNGNEEAPITSIVSDVDFVKIVADYVGIPYDIFSKGSEISEDHAWTKVVRELLSDMSKVERPLLLQLGLARQNMVGAASDEDGTLKVDLTWAPSCYDLSDPEAKGIGDAYVNYTMWMVREFKPAYVVNFAEANIFYAKCGGAGAAWNALAAIQRRAYEAIKAWDPTIIVFASFNLEALYGDKLDGWNEEQYQGISLMAYDSFAMASYPFGIRNEEGVFATPYDLPADYFSRVLGFHPDEKRLSVVETGWNNVSISVGEENECFENFPYSDQSFAADYFEFVLNSATSYQFLLLTWFSSLDVLPKNVVDTCYVRTDGRDPESDACMQDYWCLAVNQAKNAVAIPGATALFSEVLLKAFGTMGLKEYDGTSRGLLLDRWREVLALPLQDETIVVSQKTNP
ncbi:MAG: hypothetical protein P8J17_10670 [Halioglobus sp.]|nr:hypothetical protein [Halioglobus sp.]